MMASAVDFLPSCMMAFMNLASSSDLYLGSGRMLRLAATRLLGMVQNSAVLLSLALGTLGAVLGAALAALLDAGTVERTAHRVVTHAWQILHATATDQHD